MAADLIHVECPNCGATLPPAGPAGSYRCEYCGARFKALQVRHAKTVAGVELTPQQLAALARKAARGAGAGPVTAGGATGTVGRWVVLLVGLSVLGTGLISVFLLSRTSSDVASKLRSAVPDAVSQPNLLWDGVGGLPVPVTIAGRPAVVGRLRNLDADGALSVEAYDLTSGERIWKIEDLGTYGAAHQKVRYGVVGDRVLVSSMDARLGFYDLATGKLVSSVPLSDAVEYICTPGQAARTHGVLPPAPKDQEGMAWLEQVDDRTFRVDAAAGTLEPAGRPKWCADSFYTAKDAGSGRPLDLAFRIPSKRFRLPKVKGVRITRPFQEGDHLLAVGVKSPGTPLPLALRFDADAKKPSWKVQVADVPAASLRDTKPIAGVGGGRLVVVFGVGQDNWRMTAFDVTDGARLWSRDLRPVFAVDDVDAVTVTDRHVLLVHMSALEVYAADTGELKHVIGRNTYE